MITVVTRTTLEAVCRLLQPVSRSLEPDMRKLNVNLQVCKTVYDTITEQKCEISYETVYDEVACV